MLSFSSPLLLLALLAVPLLWWLHRFREQGRLFPVAALFLWSGGEDSGSGGRLAPRAQPLWILRAALVCLLALALGGLHWRADTASMLTVWVDDSPSMYSTDGFGQTRLQRGLLELRDQVEQAKYASITLRSLGMPGRSRTLPVGHASPAGEAWYPTPGGEPAPPAPLAMPVESEHWLLSDGASQSLEDWIGSAPLSRLVMMGGARDNVGISSLVLRRAPWQSGAARLLVTLHNSGPQGVERMLAIRTGTERLLETRIVLEPGEQAAQLFTLQEHVLEELSPQVLSAQLSPADALVLDDELEIPAGASRAVSVGLSGSCGNHLRAALLTCPGLRLVEAGEAADLAVLCGPGPVPDEGPAIRFATGDSVALPPGDLAWHRANHRLRQLFLQPDSLRMVASAGVRDSGAALLTVGATPLVTHDPRRRIVSVGLDFAAPQSVRLPEYPLLVSGLVTLALGHPGEPGLVAARREPGFSRIATREFALNTAAPAATAVTAQRDLAGGLILAALLLLCADLFLLFWRRVRQGRRLEDWRGQHEP
jgi:hypothetical protein